MRFPVVLALLLLAAPVNGIVVRHDVEDAAFRADPANFPFLILLYRSKEGFGDCVATLVSPQWAVTAAHCTEVEVLSSALAKGGYPVEIAGTRSTIVEVRPHPGKLGDRPVDLALLKLARPVANVRPVNLYRDRDELGREVLLPGWGDPGDGLAGARRGDGQFRVAENRIDKIEEGRVTWLFDSPASGKALAREGISGPGDSGGPALIMTPQGWSIVGVSSAQRMFGPQQGVYGAEELYVRVSDYLEWIDETVAAR